MNGWKDKIADLVKDLDKAEAEAQKQMKEAQERLEEINAAKVSLLGNSPKGNVRNAGNAKRSNAVQEPSKAGRSKTAKSIELEEKALRYIAKNPNQGLAAIAKGTGIDTQTLASRMTQLRKEGRVNLQGERRAATYTVVK